MLISLSSHTETNPARFSNYFSTPTIVKPFSYVCLIQAGIIRDKSTKVATIPPEFTIYIRNNAYNIFTIVINQGGADNITVTIPQLVALLNNARPAPAQQQNDIGFKFIVSEDEGFAFELLFFNQSVNVDPAKHVYGANGDTYASQYWLLAEGYPDTVPTSQNGANRQAIPSVNSTWCLGMGWDEAYYTPPLNQVNKNTATHWISANPSLINGNYAPISSFRIANNNISGTVACGNAVSNNASPPLYTEGSYFNSPNQGFQNRRISMEFSPGTGGFSLRVFNVSTGQLELISSTNAVNPGDIMIIQPLLNGDTDPASQNNLGYYGISLLSNSTMVMNYVGIMGAIANRPAGGNYLLGTNQTNPTTQTNSNNMSYVYDDQDLIRLESDSTVGGATDDYLNLFNGNNSTKWVGNTMIGCGVGCGQRGGLANNFIGTNSGWIYDQTLARPTTFPFLNAGEGPAGAAGGDVQVVNAQMKNSAGCWGFNKWSDGTARTSLQVEIPNVYRIQTDLFRFNCPTLIQVHTLFGDCSAMFDATDTNTSHRVLFGHNQANGITVALANAETWDIKIAVTDKTGNLPIEYLELTLEDANAGGTRINIKESTNTGTSYNYTWWIQYNGERTGAIYPVKVTCIEVANDGTSFTVSEYNSAITNIPNGRQQIRSINYMGGANPLDGFYIGGGGGQQYRYQNMSPNTMFSHFRIYQKSENSTLPTEPWSVLVNSLIPNYSQAFAQAGAEGVVPSTPTLPFFYTSRVTQLFPLPAQQANIENYMNIPYPNPSNTSTWFFTKGSADDDVGIGYHRLDWYDYSNIIMFNNIHSPLNSITTNLSADAYAGTGQGIVNPIMFDTVVDIESPEQNDDGNYLQNPGFDGDEGVNHPLSKITMDLDVLNIPSEKLKIQLTNLPHNSINGVTNSLDKTIYEIPLIENVSQDNEQEIVEITAPTKCWIPLNNAGEIPLNQIDVRIATVENIEATELRKDTNIMIEIQDDIRLLN